MLLVSVDRLLYNVTSAMKSRVMNNNNNNNIPDSASFDHAGEVVVNAGTVAIRAAEVARVAYVNSNN